MSVAVKKLVDGENTIIGHFFSQANISLVFSLGGSITCIVDMLLCHD